MSPPLTYGPAYLGLCAALVLGMACNTFLDIQYGSFGFETLLWTGVFAYTLRSGWRQRGQADESGSRRQKVVLLIGAVATVIVFIPLWGFPRAGLYILGVLQASVNCVTTTRRHLYLGLLTSLIMVIFAAAHARADWTMLFYLLPYVVAVVFTLVSEQISRRAQDVRRDGLGVAHAGGQGAAIAVATATILLLGGLLYAVTPQTSLTHLFWKYGQPGRLGTITSADGAGGVGNAQDATGAGAGQGKNGADGGALPSIGGLPTPAQMREAARRPGMPKWQASAMTTIADAAEAVGMTMQPIELGLEALWRDFKRWLREHQAELMSAFWALSVLALLAAAWLLLREARPVLWLFAHLDYLRFGLLKGHATGSRGARQYYAAMERLLDLHGLRRSPTANTREYLNLAGHRFQHVRREVAELTLIFERARYWNMDAGPAELARMRELYRRLFWQIGQLTAAT